MLVGVLTRPRLNGSGCPLPPGRGHGPSLPAPREAESESVFVEVLGEVLQAQAPAVVNRHNRADLRPVDKGRIVLLGRSIPGGVAVRLRTHLPRKARVAPDRFGHGPIMAGANCPLPPAQGQRRSNGTSGMSVALVTPATF